MPVWVIVLVVAILGGQALMWAAILLWLSKRNANLKAALTAELAESGEPITLGPEGALYRGATRDYSNIGGNGVAALTPTRLIFRKAIGGRLEIPLADIEGVREDRWFRRAWKGGRLQTILQMKGGAEVGFLFHDHAAWRQVLEGKS